MTWAQREILAGGSVLLLVCAVFPPWSGLRIYDHTHPHVADRMFLGWQFVLSRPVHSELAGAHATIDAGILLVEVVIVTATTTLALVFTTPKRSAE